MTVIEEYHRLMAVIRQVSLPDTPDAAETRTEAVVLMGAAALMLMRNKEATLTEAMELAREMMDAALNGDCDGTPEADVLV